VSASGAGGGGESSAGVGGSAGQGSLPGGASGEGGAPSAAGTGSGGNAAGEAGDAGQGSGGQVGETEPLRAWRDATEVELLVKGELDQSWLEVGFAATETPASLFPRLIWEGSGRARLPVQA